MGHGRWLLVLCLPLATALAQTTTPMPAAAPAQETFAAATTPDAVIDMPAVAVSGVQPGPGMWRVSKGDHHLWILGTVSPLPNRLQWKSEQVEAVLAQADQVLGSPGITVDTDLGFFGKLMLAPSAFKAGRNPGDVTLQEILPADLYARWSRLKAQYIGRDRGIEKKRPIVAASELYFDAIKQSGLGDKPVIRPVFKRAMKKRKLDYTPATLELRIADPKAAIAEFRGESLDDVECMRKTLDLVEHDIPAMVERANAWAVGDIEALQRSPAVGTQAVCVAAFSQSRAARKRGLTDVEARVKAMWLEVAEQALQQSDTTVATLPVSELLATDGYLAAFRARGYEITEP